MFETFAVKGVIRTTKAANPDATIVIKSTIPVAFVEDVRGRRDCDMIAAIRITSEIADVETKVFMRNLFGSD